jgi:hypothetical protein
MKRLMIVAVAVAVLALGVVAIGGAAADEHDGLVGSFLARVAEKLGVSEDELKTAIDEARDETIDEAVDEGLLTEEQAERLQEREFPLRGRLWHGPRHLHVLDAAAEVLEMEKDDLLEQLRDGNSLAEIAEAQGVSVEDFKAALLDQVKAQLDEQADDTFRRIEENIDRIVNGEGCLGGFGGMRHGPRGFGGPGFGPGGSGGMWFSPSSDGGAETTETSDVTA